MATKIQPTTTTTTSPASFPNYGVSLAFLESIANSPEMQLPMIKLARPDLTDQQLNDMDSPSLCALARDLRVFSDLNGTEEFAKYNDVSKYNAASISDNWWRAALRSPPTTTTQVCLCLIKPATEGTNLCYALAVSSSTDHIQSGLAIPRTLSHTHGVRRSNLV